MTDYQTVSRGLDDLSRDSVKLVYVEHSFDLGEDSGQEAKVAASHSNQLCDDLWWELLIRKFNAYGVQRCSRSFCISTESSARNS